MTSQPAAVTSGSGPTMISPYPRDPTYPRRYSGNCWAAKQPAELSCTNHSSTSTYTYRHESLCSCDVYKSFSRPVLFKTAVKGTIKVGGPSAAEGAPRGSPVASKTRGGELVIKPRHALATTTSGGNAILRTRHQDYAFLCRDLPSNELPRISAMKLISRKIQFYPL